MRASLIAPSLASAPPPQVIVKEAPKPTSYNASITTNPAGAEVFNGDERLGVTPLSQSLPASDDTLELVLKKKGFKDASVKVTPNRDHDFVVDLVALPKEHAHVTHSAKPAKADTAPAKAETPAIKPPTDTPKPAGKLRDLKDPFAN